MICLRNPPRFAAGILCAFFLLSFAENRSRAETPLARRKVIIDQDALGPGGSNMASILLLTQSPAVEVVGITIESGDGWNQENVAHTLRLLEIVGRTDIPVFAGVTRPLLNSAQATAVWEARYGKLHYKGAWQDTPKRKYHEPETIPPLVEGEPTLKPSAEHAVNFLLRQVREYPGQITIIALGPLTNLAVAAKLDESFAQNAAALVLMGGSLNPTSVVKDSADREFKHAPRLEFNLRWDPEAAKITLHAPWKRITVVPVDATTRNRSTPELMAKLKELNTPAGNYLVKYHAFVMPMWDEITAAVWLQPALIDQSEILAFDVETDSGAAYGEVLSWEAGHGPGLGERDVTVVRSIHIPEFEKTFLEILGRPPAAKASSP